MSRPEKKPSAQARRAIDAALSRDRGRLLQALSRWQARPGDAGLEQKFSELLHASVQARQARAAALPMAAVNPDLPIAAEADRIVELIREHQVVVIAGETGSGKTTQLPKLCLAAGRGAAGLIGCTQPRRIAARAVARRVAEELQVPLGGAVGYQVRFTEQVGEDTVVKFMTDGILLAEIASDRWLSRYDTLIIDEAHERSLNIDFLLGYLKQLLARRPDLKLIVTSATIDTERFAAHFGDAPVVNVEGRGYPVQVRYRPLEGEGEGESDGERSLGEGVVAACDELQREGAGDILVFLPGEREIRDLHRILERRQYRNTEVLPLYARLSARDQDRVFNPAGKRRIVLATNVAETSLTVPRIHYVVDPGLARVKRYSPRQKLDRLHVEPISQASADQRAGRCGRVAPGVCIRLYAQSDFESRPRYTDPEIRRAALAGVILRMLALRLGAIERFPFVEPPDPRAIADGWQQLTELGAIDAERALTTVGRQMARLPVDVKLARMLVAADALGCLPQVLVIASFLGIQDPRERPPDARAAADAAHAEFADPRSEFLGILKLWEAYRAAHEELTQSQLRKWAQKHFLGYLRLREWRELHRQLKLVCEELGWRTTAAAVDAAEGEVAAASNKAAAGQGRGRRSRARRARAGDAAQKVSVQNVSVQEGAQPANAAAAGKAAAREREQQYANLHRALIAGLPTQVGHLSERGIYEGPRGRKFQLFPGSVLARKPPPWVLSALLLDTEKVWALGNAAIEPQWVIDMLPQLLARRHFDPRWSRSQGRVLGSEQISLFGLVLAPKRPIHYGGLYPQEARELFVHDALLTGDINSRAGFLQRNLATLAKAREEEAKQRRVGLVVDEDWQARWYLDRLPAHVHNAQALDAWYGKLDASAKAALEWSLDELMVGDASQAERFPPYLPVGDARLAVRYRFEPGAVDDGMTVAVPLHLLNALDEARLSWLAPGFVQDKAAALIRSLPKAQRRNFVPAPDFARAFAEAHPQPEADALESTLARFLKKLTGVELLPSDFDIEAIEPHLRASLRLFEAAAGRRGERRVLAESRDLAELRARFGERARAAFAARAAQDLARQGLTAFPTEPVPESVPGAGGVPAWPALQDDGDSVSLGVHAERELARRLHPQGVRRLLRIALADKLRQARRQLPVQPKTSLLYAAIESQAPRADGAQRQGEGDRLREDLVEGAFAALSAEGLDGIRSAEAFDALVQTLGKAVFGEAMRRLQQAETILSLVAEARARLDSPLLGWASGNLDDMRAQLDALAGPGFLRQVPAEALAQYPRWLKALALRGERALRDPVRDQQRMLQIAPFAAAVEAAMHDARAHDPAWQALRWELEELRVATHAQELAQRGAISARKFASRLAALEQDG